MNEEQYVNSVRKTPETDSSDLLAHFLGDCRKRLSRHAPLPESTRSPILPASACAKRSVPFKLDEAPTKPLISGSDLIPLGVEPGSGDG
jgi:hypothetical protein